MFHTLDIVATSWCAEPQVGKWKDSVLNKASNSQWNESAFLSNVAVVAAFA
jgi:hypothetical protein